MKPGRELMPAGRYINSEESYFIDCELCSEPVAKAHNSKICTACRGSGIGSANLGKKSWVEREREEKAG